MMRIRRAHERGQADHGWLRSAHTFSFADYYDPAHMGFGVLRVINEDRLAPGQGFSTHPHRDMEILTYVLEGSLEHRDSMGNGTVIRRGDLQRMSAGSGVTHSEKNASDQEPVHLLQIWVLPAERGLPPSYEQRHFSEAEKRGRLRLLASRDGREGSVTIHQDVALYATVLRAKERVSASIAPGRRAWLHVARGAASVNGELLQAGDAAALTDEPHAHIEGIDHAEVLLFDLP